MGANCSGSVLLDISRNTKYFVQKLTDPSYGFLRYSSTYFNVLS